MCLWIIVSSYIFTYQCNKNCTGYEIFKWFIFTSLNIQILNWIVDSWSIFCSSFADFVHSCQQSSMLKIPVRSDMRTLNYEQIGMKTISLILSWYYLRIWYIFFKINDDSLFLPLIIFSIYIRWAVFNSIIYVSRHICLAWTADRRCDIEHICLVLLNMSLPELNLQWIHE